MREECTRSNCRKKAKERQRMGERKQKETRMVTKDVGTKNIKQRIMDLKNDRTERRTKDRRRTYKRIEKETTGEMRNEKWKFVGERRRRML